MNNDEGAAPRIQSVSRAVAILLEVTRHDDGVTAPELSRTLGINRATTYHLVQTLVAERFLVRTATRRYKLGMRIGAVVQAFPRQLDASERLLPYTRHLSVATGETAFAAALDPAGIIVLAHVAGQHPVQVTATVGL